MGDRNLKEIGSREAIDILEKYYPDRIWMFRACDRMTWSKCSKSARLEVEAAITEATEVATIIVIGDCAHRELAASRTLGGLYIGTCSSCDGISRI